MNPVKATCCEQGRKEIESDYDRTKWEIGMFAQKDQPYVDYPELEARFVEIKFCPWCGIKLPHPREGLFKKGTKK